MNYGTTLMWRRRTFNLPMCAGRIDIRTYGRCCQCESPPSFELTLTVPRKRCRSCSHGSAKQPPFQRGITPWPSAAPSA